MHSALSRSGKAPDATAESKAHFPYPRVPQVQKLHTALPPYHLKEKDGYLTSNELSNWINEDVDIYLCGGITFMDTIFDELEKLNIGQADVHFEPFGPKMSITNV